MIQDRDIHWLAGLLEGEGSFGYKAWSPRIGLQTTDADVVERAAVLLQREPKGPLMRDRNRKPIWYVQVYGAEAAAWMMTLYCLLGKRRKGQIRGALERWRKAKKVMQPWAKVYKGVSSA